MKEHPILFCAPMVRAILAGRKTMTRRLVKYPLGEGESIGDCHYTESGSGFAVWRGGGCTCREIKCPYGHADPIGWGDILWVRETWKPWPSNDCEKPRCMPEDHRLNQWSGMGGVIYSATWEKAGGHHWHPSIHMPRWASRILLKVIEIRCERLQDITKEDAMAEGIETSEVAGPWKIYGKSSFLGTSNPIRSFQSLWESINGAGAWDINPWVWVVSFERLEVTP